MGKVKVAGFGVSLDGFGAGKAQSLEHPLGLRGEEMFQWFFPTRSFRQMLGQEGGDTGIDDTFARRAMAGFGAFILGRNMFGPVRGDWPDDYWKGWWGDNPPYHTPTFILTNYPRDPIVMEGGTTFFFVTDGIQSALEQAKAAAGDLDVKIGGGVSTVRQYLTAGLVDEIHLAVAPVVLGQGEALFAGITDQGARLPSARRFAARERSLERSARRVRIAARELEAAEIAEEGNRSRRDRERVGEARPCLVDAPLAPLRDREKPQRLGVGRIDPDTRRGGRLGIGQPARADRIGNRVERGVVGT